MKLYHGTTTRVLNRILKHGIEPRKTRKGNWPEMRGRPDMVYLTQTVPCFYAMQATHKKHKMLVIEVDIPDEVAELVLYPDEDCIADHLIRHEKWDRSKVSREAKRLVPLNQALWPNSIEGNGCVAYNGTVPVDMITRYAVLDNHTDPHLMLFLSDDGTSVIAHQLLKEDRKKKVAWLFGDEPMLPQRMPEGMDKNYDRMIKRMSAARHAVTVTEVRHAPISV